MRFSRQGISWPVRMAPKGNSHVCTLPPRATMTAASCSRISTGFIAQSVRPNCMCELVEAPHHNVPRLAAGGDEAGLAAAIVQAPDGRVVAADPIRGALRLARIVKCFQPVRANQHARLMTVHRVTIMGDVLPKAFPRKLPPGGPVRIAGALGRLGDARLPAERRAAAVAVAGVHRPQVAVDPKTVHAVTIDEFQQLGNHQLIDVGAPRAHPIAVRGSHSHEAAADRLAARPADAPVGMLAAGRDVEDAGIMGVQRQAELSRCRPPSGQGVPCHTRADRGGGRLADQLVKPGCPLLSV